MRVVNHRVRAGVCRRVGIIGISVIAAAVDLIQGIHQVNRRLGNSAAGGRVEAFGQGKHVHGLDIGSDVVFAHGLDNRRDSRRNAAAARDVVVVALIVAVDVILCDS